jgi:hypothetical protein
VACADGHGEYVHYGATTQDVLDTGQILALKETASVLQHLIGHLGVFCRGMALWFGKQKGRRTLFTFLQLVQVEDAESPACLARLNGN